MIKRFLREYLSLSSGERRGFLVLISLVFALLAIRTILPGLLGNIGPVKDGPDVQFPEYPLEIPLYGKGMLPTYFNFDPNTASLDTLQLLGISYGVARTLVNYRESGGKFRSSEDLLKVYGMERKDYLLIKPWVNIPEPAQARIYGDSHPVPESLRELSPDNKGFRRFELNRADTSLLKGVLSIGPVYANRIIKFRELLGGFYSIAQLREVYGLSDEQYSMLCTSCFIDSSLVRVINLNTAGREELLKHPYLDAYQVGALLSYRSLEGSYISLGEIPDNRLLPKEVWRKVSPYLGLTE